MEGQPTPPGPMGGRTRRKKTTRTQYGHTEQDGEVCRTPSGNQQERSLIVNLSDRNLTDPEVRVLERGLGFVPVTNLDSFKLHTELQNFFRSIRLKTFFKDMPSLQITQGDSGLRPKSTFAPPTSAMPVELVAFEQAVLKEVNHIPPQKEHSFRNLSRAEHLAVASLSNDPDIVIKSADKGGATVIMTAANYRNECLRLLNDQRNYEVLSTDPTTEVKILITGMVEQATANRWITEREASFLINNRPRVPYFYILPKIHKGLPNPPGRPIVSGVDSVLEPLSKYADVFLRPILQKTNTYLRDTKDVLRLLEELSFDPEVDWLITLDVESLYTSLPHAETLEVIEEVLFNRDWTFNTPRCFVLECIATALTKNFFCFENTFYLQKHGTSMGSTFAPSLAGLYVHYLETKKILHTSNPYYTQVREWKRYIDDVFMIWRGDKESALGFVEWLNSQDRFLKFTSTIHKTEMVFLDLNIRVLDNKLISNTHTKPTARNCLLDYTSFHPKHLRDNLPFGQFLRLRRNCSRTTDYKEQANILSEKLRSRNYPEKVITNAKRRARNNNRAALLEENTREPGENKRLVCVTTYNVASNYIQKTINKHWSILTSGGLDYEKPLFSYKRGANLKDSLVHTRPFKPSVPSTSLSNLPRVVGHYACGSCSICHLTERQKEIKFDNGFTWTLKTMTNCNSERVIYLITCPCGLRYVGMTTRKIKVRILEHRSNIRCKRSTTKMLTHFDEMDHGPNDFRWTVLEQSPLVPNLEQSLLKKEQRWVFRLQSDTRGLNDHIPWNQLWQ